MRHDGQWKLTDVSGHLPDLDFSLRADDGRPVHGSDFRGEVTLVYFGYTHCPDVCPETLARLTQVLHGVAANAPVRILFVSVDPARDTPRSLHAYVQAFDPRHVVGLTGTTRQIEDVARRYRVAYQAEPANGTGDYEVTHSSAVYFFDAAGHARLIATATDTIDSMTHDLKQLLHPST